MAGAEQGSGTQPTPQGSGTQPTPQGSGTQPTPQEFESCIPTVLGYPGAGNEPGIEVGNVLCTGRLIAAARRGEQYRTATFPTTVHPDDCGFYEENLGGIGIISMHTHQVAHDCMKYGSSVNPYAPVRAVQVPKECLESWRTANKRKYEEDHLLAVPSKKMCIATLSKTHFVFAHKLVAEGNRTLFNEGKEPIRLHEDDIQGRAIQDKGFQCILYNEKLWHDKPALLAIMCVDGVHSLAKLPPMASGSQPTDVTGTPPTDGPAGDFDIEAKENFEDDKVQLEIKKDRLTSLSPNEEPPAVQPLTTTVPAVLLKDGTPIPQSTFDSEFVRLLREANHLAISRSQPTSTKYQKRKIRDAIRSKYGKRCYKCGKIIVIEYGGHPLTRRLDHDECPIQGDTETGVFHSVCWEIYKKDKTNKYKREAYHYFRACYNANVARRQPATDQQNQPTETSGSQPTDLDLTEHDAAMNAAHRQPALYAD